MRYDEKNGIVQTDSSSSKAAYVRTQSLGKNQVSKEVPSAAGCSYLTRSVPEATHKPDTYICINGCTRKCELMGKNERDQNVYNWVIIIDASCIHLG